MSTKEDRGDRSPQPSTYGGSERSNVPFEALTGTAKTAGVTIFGGRFRHRVRRPVRRAPPLGSAADEIDHDRGSRARCGAEDRQPLFFHRPRERADDADRDGRATLDPLPPRADIAGSIDTIPSLQFADV